MSKLLTFFTLSFAFTCSLYTPNLFADHGDIVSKPFVIGEISSKPKKRIKATLPISEYVAAAMSEYGYTHGEVKVASSVDEMNAMLKSGEVTMAATTIYSAMIMESQGSAKISNVRWKKGVDRYHSIFFSHKDSNILSLDDLKGKVIAFEKSDSTSAFYIPTIHLLNQGFELQKVGSPRVKPDSNKIGYIFIDEQLNRSDEVNMSIWVYNKRVDASVFSNQDWEATDTTPLKAKEKLNIIEETKSYPRGVMLISNTVSTKEMKAINLTLFDANQTDLGKDVLEQFQKTTQFTPISPDVEATLNEAKGQIDTVINLAK